MLENYLEKIQFILAIDDEPEVLSSVKNMLRSNPNLIVDTCTSASTALTLIKMHPRKYAVVLLDYFLPDKNGDELIRELLKVNNDLIIVMHSGTKSPEAIISSMKTGAVDFLEKGISANDFRAKVASFCKKYEETIRAFGEPINSTEAEEYISTIGMCGTSPEMVSVTTQVLAAAKTDSNVIITGPSGTGKELVAKAIHNLSNRKNYNFIAVNMGAIPKDLFESEMFGHLKGSFTTALYDKIGSFKAAHGGTIFLDEIGDLPLDMQVKLLRVLQEREVHPVGANKTEKINTRIIAATNLDLEKAKDEGLFREDLYYRLNIINIKMQALRERPEDIRPLVNHFKKKFKGQNKVILLDVIRKFEKYKWPGNIRELEGEMQKLIEVTPDDKITLKHLDSKFFEERNMSVTNLMNFDYCEVKRKFAEQELDYINKRIRPYRSLREAAAKGFNMTESSLRRRIQKLEGML